MRALQKFLNHHRLTSADFADWLGVDKSLVHRWVNDGAIPSPDKMRAIYRLTKGAVRPDHFYDLPRIGPPRSGDDEPDEIEAAE